MCVIIRESADAGQEGGEVYLVDGAWRTTFIGSYLGTPAGGFTGTLLGFYQTGEGSRVFEVTGVERSAATAFSIVEDRDNDRFLAYTLSGDDLILGSGRGDYLIGFGGDDAVRGRTGDDELFGGIGRDYIAGGAGDDFLAGGADADRMDGGFGADTYLLDHGDDQVAEGAGAGTDTILSYVDAQIAANVERLVLIGGARIEGRGGAASEEIEGNAAGNRIAGGHGRDRLDGDGGGDILDGGFGRDILVRGRGADVFLCRDARAVNGDRVLDFGHGADRIDLAAIDAAPRAGDQAFDFIGANAFSGRAGELAMLAGRLAGDIDGNGAADFAILLAAGAESRERRSHPLIGRASSHTAPLICPPPASPLPTLG